MLHLVLCFLGEHLWVFCHPLCQRGFLILSIRRSTNPHGSPANLPLEIPNRPGVNFVAECNRFSVSSPAPFFSPLCSRMGAVLRPKALLENTPKINQRSADCKHIISFCFSLCLRVGWKEKKHVYVYIYILVHASNSTSPAPGGGGCFPQ